LIAAVAEREQLHQEIEKLEGGRRKLNAQIAEVDTKTAEIENAKADAATKIANAIRDGLDWAVGSALSFGQRDASIRLAGSRLDIEVARRALDQIEDEVAKKREQIAALSEEIPAIADMLIRQHGIETCGKDYREAVEQLRASMTRLLAYERAVGKARVGRVVCVLPGQPLAGDEGTHDVPVAAVKSNIDRAVGVIEHARRLLLEDPALDLDAIVQFPAVDPNTQDSIPYDRLSQPERDSVDRSYAMLGSN
jgi:hypothetical protein